jgi:hypothetical protein
LIVSVYLNLPAVGWPYTKKLSDSFSLSPSPG